MRSIGMYRKLILGTEPEDDATKGLPKGGQPIWPAGKPRHQRASGIAHPVLPAAASWLNWRERLMLH